MEGGKNCDSVVEELSGRIKELEYKLGEQEKEKVRPKLSEEAVKTLLSEEGVPKWMDITSPYVTWHYITPHYITLHYITSQNITLHYITS